MAAFGNDSQLSTIYTLCDNASTMAEIALALSEYLTPGCEAMTYIDPSDTTASSYRSLTCTESQIATVSLCAASEVDSSQQHSAMRAMGGNDLILPIPNLVRHYWTDSGTTYLVYEIHMVNSDITYGSCPTEASGSAMIIPCVRHTNDTTSHWCRQVLDQL